MFYLYPTFPRVLSAFQTDDPDQSHHQPLRSGPRDLPAGLPAPSTLLHPVTSPFTAVPGSQVTRENPSPDPGLEQHPQPLLTLFSFD